MIFSYIFIDFIIAFIFRLDYRYWFRFFGGSCSTVSFSVLTEPIPIFYQFFRHVFVRGTVPI